MRFLAGVDGDEGRRHAVVAAVGAVVAHRIAAPGRFDLDHLGAEQPQQMRRVRARHHMAEVGDANAFKRAAHGDPLVHAQCHAPSAMPRGERPRATEVGRPSMPKRASARARVSPSRV